MRRILDLHIHSRFSRACSKELTLPNIARECERNVAHHERAVEGVPDAADLEYRVFNHGKRQCLLTIKVDWQMITIRIYVALVKPG